MPEQLKPCPFPHRYGSDFGVVLEPCETATKDGFYYIVWCLDCMSQGPKCDTESEAIAAWNTRADQSGWVSVEDAELFEGAQYWTLRGFAVTYKGGVFWNHQRKPWSIIPDPKQVMPLPQPPANGETK